MRITVDASSLRDLESDLLKIEAEARKDMARVVEKNVHVGEQAEQRIARGASGIHGRFYYKRITSEMTSDLEGEWGPHDGGTPVGGGWRHATNTDSAKSADEIGPKFAEDSVRLFDRWFWPA